MRHTTRRDITSKATKQKQQDQINNCKLKTNTCIHRTKLLYI